MLVAAVAREANWCAVGGMSNPWFLLQDDKQLNVALPAACNVVGATASVYPGANWVLTSPLILLGGFVNLFFSYSSKSHAEIPSGRGSPPPSF